MGSQDDALFKKLPVPASSVRQIFRVRERPAFLIVPPPPAGAAPARRPATAATLPWVWYAPTLPAYPAEEERWMFERLVAAGHRRIHFVGSVDPEHPQFSERYAGYRETLLRHGLPAFEAHEVRGADRVAAGREALTRLLETGDQADAVFAANDAIALGALEALGAAGLRVPDDFGVVGFDGLGAGVHSHPPLTTIEPDFPEAGRALVARICEPESDPLRRVPVNLIDRGSVRQA